MPCPAAGGDGGILGKAQDYQFRLRVVGVGCGLGFVHILCGDDLARGLGGGIHAGKNILGLDGGQVT